MKDVLLHAECLSSSDLQYSASRISRNYNNQDGMGCITCTSKYHRRSNNQIHLRSFSSELPPARNEQLEEKDKNIVGENKKDSICQISKTTSQLSTPSSSIKSHTNETSKTFAIKTKDMLISAISSMVSLLLKTPGVLWFYTTNPTKFKEKLIELKEAAKKEAHHYWMGSKLLAADIRTARQILGRTLNGSSLTRRERKQLLRTVSDVFRLVPMSIFVLIPFMEFALPFALKMFPNMLPSTFQDSLKAEENMKRELKSRLAMAEFFQETLQDLAKEQKKAAANRKELIINSDDESTPSETTKTLASREETAASFLDFIEKAREGAMFPPEVIIRYSTFFKDDLTLDNMPRMQLINMCKYMSIPPYGSDNLLRFQLRHKIRILIEDDQRILWEGIDSLTKMELREACQERGMRSTGLSKQGYKRALQQWIDLSVNRSVPISLLIMSRTFFLQEESLSKVSKDDEGSKSVAGLADAISGLDKEVLNEIVLDVATSEEKTSNPEVLKIKLEVLEQQNELIEEEKREREAALKKAEQEKAEKESLEKEKVIAHSEVKHEIPKLVDEEKNEIDGKLFSDGSVKEYEKELSSKSKTIIEQQLAIGSKRDSTLEGVKDSVTSFDTELGTKDTLDSENKVDNAKEEEEDESSLSTEELDAISQLVSPDPVQKERMTLEKIKAAMQDKEEEEGVKDNFEEIFDHGVSNDSRIRKNILSDSNRSDKSVKESNVKELFIVDKSQDMATKSMITMKKNASDELDSATNISMDGSLGSEKTGEVTEEESENEEKETEYVDIKLQKAVDRLKFKVESMIGKIEVQLSDVETKIGDKLHYLDKDMDGILSREEMAICLQSVLKRPLTFDEAMVIASDMDENEDGLFSLDELSNWLETNKVGKLVKEGRHAELEDYLTDQKEKAKEKEEIKNVDKK
eukprot:CAMPEP_0184857306 /NCGR_PEP_ID=MMETSP0580-20130426/2468_1 /TAXON_ID=1118495 /ORGANISM="Dactyliosolen fragilissimus" /LENGTH=919 /DNA_ID=CAMNT_0027352827 /DNA_START=403 /DNA_END=3162 /DNA_ORIENTATION=-